MTYKEKLDKLGLFSLEKSEWRFDNRLQILKDHFSLFALGIGHEEMGLNCKED